MNCLAGWYAYENVSNFCVRKNSDNYNELAHMIKDSNDRKKYISLKKRNGASNMEDTLFSILEDITGTDEVRDNPDVDLFEEGLMDSLATVQLLVEIEGQLGVQVPVSEFDRAQWNTPNKIIEQVKVLQA